MSDKDDKSEENLEKPWWSEAVRDLTSAGLAAVFMTEDSVRNYLKEKKFPKEMVAQLLEGVGRKKEDLYALVAKEVGRVVSKIDLSAEVSRFLEKHQIHFEAKVSFEPKGKETARAAAPNREHSHSRHKSEGDT
jgi:hypothetical protein